MENYIDINRILELMPQPVFCVRDGSIFFRNHAAGQLFLEPGLPVAELLGDAAEDYRLFQGSSLYLELSLPGKSVEACATRLDDIDVFVVEMEHDHLQTMALTALQFRDPLSDVLAILNRMPVQEDPLYRGRLNRRLFQLQRMVFNMADASRYANERNEKMVFLNISSRMEELLQHIEDLTAQSGIKLVRSCPKEQIITILNEEKLERALYNMISNAMKVTPKGGTIEVKLQRINTRLYLSVRDFGDGIPDAIKSTVYTRYRRHPGLDAGREGLGLGMTLIRSAAISHGGTVLIDHPDDIGTRVTMSLAIRKNPENLLRSNILSFDYAGEQDHGLLELADILPPEIYSNDI